MNEELERLRVAYKEFASRVDPKAGNDALHVASCNVHAAAFDVLVALSTKVEELEKDLTIVEDRLSEVI